jgi:alpha-glucosidase
MQWDSSPNAGFSSAPPWLPLADDWMEDNVEQQSRRPASMLSLYRELLALRRRESAFLAGRYVPLDLHPRLFTFGRAAESGNFIVALNLGDSQPEFQAAPGTTVVLSTHMDRAQEGVSRVEVRPHEGLILRVPAEAIATP